VSFSPALIEDARDLLAACRAARVKLATAESCTGGLVAALLTEIPGSSDVVERGFVVYSNEAKQELLGVPAATLARYGAVSVETAQLMAEGALTRSRAEIAIAITGVAGPGGGSQAKPVGMVCFACARAGRATARREERYGDLGRHEIRAAAVATALAMFRDAL
jgi:nicotinamide-nucleotide amidase